MKEAGKRYFLNLRAIVVVNKGQKKAREEKIDRMLSLALKLGGEKYGESILKGGVEGYHDTNLTDRQRTLASIYLTLKCEKLRRQSIRDHIANPCYIEHNAIVLKRGISWREMFDIFKKGRVTGRLNLWHSHDKRRVVFWGDQSASDGVLLSQANDLDRQASIILSATLKVAATKIRSAYVSYVRDKSEKQKELIQIYEKKQEWIKIEQSARDTSDWTSAVLITHPISGAHVWPHQNKTNMMGRMNEYGLPSGFVTLDDIQEIKLFKERELIAQGTPDEIFKFISDNNAPYGTKLHMSDDRFKSEECDVSSNLSP